MDNNSMYDMKEMREKVEDRIRKNLQYYFEKPEYSQNKFVLFCKEKHNLTIEQGNFSKFIRGGYSSFIQNPFMIQILAEYLRIEVKKLIWEDMREGGNIVEIMQRNLGEEINEENFISDVNSKEFKRYLNNVYYCYCSPTVAKETTFLRGTIIFKRQFVENRCHVVMEIDTNQKKEEGKGKYIKRYQGEMIISRNLNICFCLLANGELGECLMISFRHATKLNNTKHLGGMAVVCMPSAGEPYPTIERMLISKKKIAEEQLDKISGYLNLGMSKMLVKKEELRDYLNEIDMSEENQRIILNEMNKSEYYEIYESTLRGLNLKQERDVQREVLMMKIRQLSYGLRYCKVSNKLDEHILEVIKKLPD